MRAHKLLPLMVFCFIVVPACHAGNDAMIGGNFRTVALKSLEANQRVFVSALTHESTSAYISAKVDADKALTDVELGAKSRDEKYVSSLLRAWYGFATMLHFEIQTHPGEKQRQNRYADGGKQCSLEINVIIRPHTITGEETTAAASRISCLDTYNAMLRDLSKREGTPKKR